MEGAAALRNLIQPVPERFEIGVHYPPPADYINDEQYDLLKDAHVTCIDHAFKKEEDNFKSLELLAVRGMKATCYDNDLENIRDASEEEIEHIAHKYGNHSCIYGIYVKDEPSAIDFDRYAYIYNELRELNPNQIPYVNLFPMYADEEKQLCITNPLTYLEDLKPQATVCIEVEEMKVLGQLFRTPSGINRRMESIELQLNISSELLKLATLSIYNNKSKEHEIARGFPDFNRHSGSCNRVRFMVYADIENDSEYYLELTLKNAGKVFLGVNYAKKEDEKYNCNIDGKIQDWIICFSAFYKSTYTDYLEGWIKAADPVYLLFDFYPFLIEGDRWNYFLNLELARDVVKRKQIPVGGYLQSVGIKDALRRPKENELRYNVYTMLAYGVKKLNWFTWWTPEPNSGGEIFTDAIITADGKKTDLYIPVKILGEEIENLGRTLIDLKLISVYHSGELPAGTKGIPKTFFWQPLNPDEPLILSLFIDKNDRKYIMIVNKDYKSSKTVKFFILPSPQTITEISRRTGLEIIVDYKASSGELVLDFSPGDGRLFALPIGY